MSAEIKQIATQVITHPKTAWLSVFIVNVSEWYIEWISPVIIAMTSILSLIIMILLVRFHLLNTQKLKIDIEKQGEESEKIRELERRITVISERKKPRI